MVPAVLTVYTSWSATSGSWAIGAPEAKRPLHDGAQQVDAIEIVVAGRNQQHSRSERPESLANGSARRQAEQRITVFRLHHRNLAVGRSEDGELFGRQRPGAIRGRPCASSTVGPGSAESIRCPSRLSVSDRNVKTRPEVMPTMARFSSHAGELVGIVSRLCCQIGRPVFLSSAYMMLALVAKTA